MVCLFSREWASAVARAASRARARDSLPGIVLQRYIRLGYTYGYTTVENVEIFRLFL